MKAAFLIWSLMTVLFIGIGISTLRQKKEAGFFAGVDPNQMRDVQAYNKAVAKLWFIFAAIFELLGLPFLFCEQNSLLALVSAFAVVPLCIGLMIAYHRIDEKYKVKK